MFQFILPGRFAALPKMAAFLLSLSSVASPVFAEALFQHEGGEDPVNERWTLVRGESDGVSAKAVEEGGRGAWQITNTAGGSEGSRTWTYNAYVKPEVTREGWELTVSVRVLTAGALPGAQIAAGFVTDQDAKGNPLGENEHRSYRLYFGSTGDGRTRVRLAGTDANSYVCPDRDGTYQFKLRWKRGDEAVSFYVNDTLIAADYEGEPLNTRTRPYVMWGNTASTASDRVAHWEKIAFSPVAE